MFQGNCISMQICKSTFLPEHFCFKYSQRKRNDPAINYKRTHAKVLVKLSRPETKVVAKLWLRHMNSDLTQLSCRATLSSNDIN